jgi:hypothetical protein
MLRPHGRAWRVVLLWALWALAVEARPSQLAERARAADAAADGALQARWGAATEHEDSLVARARAAEAAAEADQRTRWGKRGALGGPAHMWPGAAPSKSPGLVGGTDAPHPWSSVGGARLRPVRPPTEPPTPVPTTPRPRPPLPGSFLPTAGGHAAPTTTGHAGPAPTEISAPHRWHWKTPPRGRPGATAAPSATPAPTTPAPTTAVPTTPPPAAPRRSMFSWEKGDCAMGVVVSSAYYKTCGSANAEEFHAHYIGNLTNPGGGGEPFTDLYLFFNWKYFWLRAPQVAIFAARLHAAGISLHFLDGDASWITGYDKRETPIEMCRALVDYNDQAPANGHVDGLIFDIEPHLLGSTWHQNATSGADNYNSFYEANFLYIFSQCKSIFDGSAVLGACISDDYYHYVTGLWTPIKAGGFIDYILLMGYYRDPSQFWYTGTGLIGGVQRNLAALVGSPVRLVAAAEFQAPQFVPQAITVYSNGTAAGLAMLGNTTLIFGDHPNYLGTSVHYDAPFFALGPTGPISPPFPWAPSCTAAGNKVTVRSDPFYTRSFSAYTYSDGAWALETRRAQTSAAVTYTFAGPAPYLVVLYDWTNGRELNYLPLVRECV